jgi:PAS domain-containing protein
MSRSSVKRKVARPKGAVQSVSADADGTGASNHRPGEQIREMEAQYRGIFEVAGEAMVIADLDGVIVEANPAFLLAQSSIQSA